MGAATDDANDSIDDACELSAGEYDLSVEPEESDYFAISLEEGERLDASIAFDDDADLDIRLLGPDEGMLDYSMSVSDSEDVSVVAEAAGEYYVVIYGYDGASNSYSFTVTTGDGDS